MNIAEFDKITREVLDPFLYPSGYRFDKGTYWCPTPGGLRRIITLDFHVRSKSSFRVHVGLNAIELHDDYGLHYIQFFTGGSMSGSPRDIPCRNEAQARASLGRIAGHLNSMILPFLNAASTPSELADLIEDPDLEPYINMLRNL